MFYLAYFDADAEPALADRLDAEVCVLRDGLSLITTELSRSKLYHAIKRLLPSDAPLLVAPLSGAPKFKGMRSGSTKWTRARM